MKISSAIIHTGRWLPGSWLYGRCQGIIGLEAEYEEVLKGTNGKILTLTDARGVELSDAGESRQEAVPGKDLIISLDRNIQEYAEQAALKVMEEKQAAVARFF